MVNEVKPVPPVNTRVTLGGTAFELRDMPVNVGLALYQALPADYKKQANQIADVLQAYATVAEIAKSKQIDPTELAQDWLRTAANTDAAKAARKQLSTLKQDAIAQLEASGINIKSIASMIPGGETMLGLAHTAEGAAAIAGTAGGLAGAAIDGAWNGAPHIWDLMKTLGYEGVHQLIGYGSGAAKDNALAFGAATMALHYQAVEERHTKPMVDLPFNDKESQLEAHPKAVAVAGWDFALQWIREHLPIVVAAFNFLTTWGENKPTWNQFVDQANVDSRALASGSNKKSFQKLVDANAVSDDKVYADSVLKAAQTVAGLKTEGTSAIANATVAGELTYRNTDGHDVNLKNGVEVSRVTPLQRVENAGQAVIGDGSTVEQVLRTGAAAAASATILNNGAKGVVRGLTANVTTPSTATEAVMDWAKKPVQLGIGEHAVTSGWKTWINFPGKIAVGLGDLTGRAFRTTVNAVTGTAGAVADVATGAAKGVHSVVNDVVTETASKTEKASKFVFGSYARYLPWVGTVAAAHHTVQDIGKGDTTGMVIHGAETAGLVMLVKAGAKRIPYVGNAISGFEGLNAAAHGDTTGVVKSVTELGTMGAGTLIGGAVGLLGGPFAPVSVPVGMTVGNTIGGYVSMFTGTMAENYMKEQALIADASGQKPTGQLPADPALAAAGVQATASANQSIADVGRDLKMTGATTAIGALNNPDDAAKPPATIAAQKRDAQVQPSAFKIG